MKNSRFGLLTLWAVLSLLGCSVDKQASKKAAWLIAHDKLGEYCNIAYPSKPDSIVTKDTTLYDTIPGESVIVHDTVPCGKNDSVIYRDVKCPPGKVIIKTQLRDTTVYKDNPNQRAAYEQQLREKDKQIKTKDDIISKQQVKIDKNDWWKTACLISWFAILLGIITRLFIYKKPI